MAALHHLNELYNKEEIDAENKFFIKCLMSRLTRMVLKKDERKFGIATNFS